MYRHIVLYKVKDRSSAEEMKKRFESMRGRIPQIISLETGIDTLESERSFDISLVMTFASKEDFLAYKANSYHVNCVASFVHSVTEKSVSTDYEF